MSIIVGIDPGKNIGIALINIQGKLLQRNIIDLAECSNFTFPQDAILVLGNGTGSKLVQKVLQKRNLKFILIDETSTTLEARRLYFNDNPPKGFYCFLPKGLRLPPKYLDDYAAYAIALNYLKTSPLPNLLG